MPEYRSVSGSAAEDLFIDLFADTLGAEKSSEKRLQGDDENVQKLERILERRIQETILRE